MNTPTDLRGAALAAVDYDPFASPALARVVPSTEAQREIWLAAKLGEDASLAYNEAVALHLRGTLDRAALAQALQDLVDRHDALRATFGPDGETFCVGERRCGSGASGRCTNRSRWNPGRCSAPNWRAWARPNTCCCCARTTWCATAGRGG
jgi:hypothetical protein